MPGTLLALPLFGVIALAIRLEGPGPVFFRQERVGWHGRPFRIWKFRTMVVGADRLGAHPHLTVGRDPRVTVVGRWLRARKLDELPQLLNVLSGEMSLVGPRPEVPHYVVFYTPEQRRVLELRPGITAHASLVYRRESELLGQVPEAEAERVYVEQILPHKVRLNLDYAEQATPLSDLSLIVRTVLRW